MTRAEPPSAEEIASAQNCPRLPDTGILQKLGCCQTKNRMMPEGRDIGERLQNECPLMRPRVRQYHSSTLERFFHLPVVNDVFVAHDIEVEGSRYPPATFQVRRFRAAAPRLRLNPLEHFQKSAGGETRESQSDGVQEIRLRLTGVRPRLVQPGRACDLNACGSQLGQCST